MPVLISSINSPRPRLEFPRPFCKIRDAADQDVRRPAAAEDDTVTTRDSSGNQEAMTSVKAKAESLTPMMKQFNRAKRANPDALLFFRMGDFYEMFYEDAKVASKVLGIALTSRSKGDAGVPMAGVPVKAYEQYLFKLIRAGYKVAICDQIEDPKQAKGLVDRAVTRIVTAGTITEEELLDRTRSSYLLSVFPAGRRTGLAWIDMSTGAFMVTDIAPAGLADEIGRIEPAEIIFPEALADPASEFMITPVSDWHFDPAHALDTLKEQFAVSTLRGFGVDDESVGVSAAGAALLYAGETQMDKPLQVGKITPFLRDDHMILNRASRSALELVANQRDGGRDNTLLASLDGTRTPMGSRLLRDWILLPSTSIETIRSRQGGVAELMENPSLRGDLAEALSRIFDIQRITTKVLANRASARDLVNLRQSIEALPLLMDLLESAHSGILFETRSRLDSLEETGALLGRAIADRPPATLKEGGLIRDGYNGELDDLRSIRSEGNGYIRQFQEREIARTGIQKLKVSFNRVFGYYIEVTHANKDMIPPDYIRKQTLKNAERYITPELKEYEIKVLTSEEKIRDLEYRLFQDIREKVCEKARILQSTAEAIAVIDVLLSLADKAAKRGYVRPEISESTRIRIREGRHPILEAAMESGTFVPNDLDFSDEARLIILTGPNMAGKSTFLRQNALIAIMAQIGSFVPAASAEIGLVDRILTPVGAADDLARGSSTVKVEMEETASILHNATEKSLIILDEVGRGTSTFDGLSLAWAISEHIHDSVGARTLFATHYHQLTGLVDDLKGVVNLSVAVREWKNEIIFLHKIVEGGTDKSYGIHVARLAGIPVEVLDRAARVLKDLEFKSPDLNVNRSGKAERRDSSVQLGLFPPGPDPVREELDTIDPEELTPIEALVLLQKLKDMTQ